MVRQRVNADVRDGEFVDEIIERGAEVVQAIPDDNSEIRRHGFKGFGYKELLTALDVNIVKQSVWLAFEPDSDFAFKALQVVERPI